MTLSNVSTAYLASAFLPGVRDAQTQLATLEVESSSGQYADLGLQLGGQNGYELSLREQDDLLQSLTAANGVTATNLSTAQSALSSLLSTAQSAASSLVTWTSGSNSGSTLQTLGQSNLQQLIAAANTSTSTGYVFAGENTAQAPMDDYYATSGSSAKSSIDAAFQSYFGFSTSSSQVANISASQMQSFLSGPYAAQFTSPNWGSNWSTASTVDSSAEIAPGDTIATSTNTNTAPFQQLAQGYAMLSEFGDIGLGAAASQALASTASSVIDQGVSSLTDAQSTLGQAQSQIKQADDNMSDQMTLLQTEIGRMDDVDPSEVATQLSTLSTQLETAYQLTAQIHSMNLAQYITT